MFAASQIAGQCPFKQGAGFLDLARNTIQYFKEPDALDFLTKKVVENELESPYSLAEVPFNHRLQFTIISDQRSIIRLLRNPRFNEILVGSEEFTALAKILGEYSPLTCEIPEVHGALRGGYKNSTFSKKKVDEKRPEIARVALEFISKTFREESFNYSGPEVFLNYTLKQSLQNIIKTREEIDIPALAQVVKTAEQLVSDIILWRPHQYLPSRQQAVDKLNVITEQIIESESDGLANDMKATGNIKMVESAVKTALVVGSGTTRSALVSILRLLLEYPDEQNILFEALLKIRQKNQNIEPQSISWGSCIELKNFVKETLRLYPPILFLARKTGENAVDSGLVKDSVAGFVKNSVRGEAINEDDKIKIPDKSSLYLSVYHSQRHPDFWDNPKEFDPSRFANRESRKGRFLAFSDGSTRCLGERFALEVIYSLIALLVLKFQIEKPLDEEGLPIEQDLHIKSGMTLQFDKDLEFRLVPREYMVG